MFNYIIYRIGQFLALSLPLKLGYAVAVFCSDLHYFFAYIDRREVGANLKAIFPEKSDREIKGIRIHIFRNFAKYLVDFFRFTKIDIAYIKRNVKIENIHYVNEALAKGKGVILLTAHFGNWELGGVIMGQLGYPFWAVALPHKDKRVNNFFNFQRASKGVKVIAFGNAVRRCLTILKDNNALALVGDRDFTKKGGVVVDFFGKPTILPEGPAAFASKTGSPIVPGFVLRNQDDSFTLRFEKPLEFIPTADKNHDLLKLVESYKVVIEHYIRKNPQQWYMFKKFWIQ